MTKHRLSRLHLKTYIKGSAISSEVAAGRGYRTIATQEEALSVQRAISREFGSGFYASQFRLPALGIPIWGVDGTRASYQLRPDKPRLDPQSGKPRKYENLPGRRGYLDLHPLSHAQLRNVREPLWITEGIRKADALTSAGELAIALYGVWNWRGMDEGGAVCRLPEWDEVPTNREVLIAFDSDVMKKRAVKLALERLGRWLEMKGARVRYVYLPDDEGGRQGVDDFLAKGGTIDDLREFGEEEVRGLPEVNVSGRQLRDSSQDVVDTLVEANDPPQVFLWGDSLARARFAGEGPIIEEFNSNSLRSHMSLVADYVKYNSKGVRINVWPSKELAVEVLSRPEWKGLPRLQGLTESPTIRPDGSIIDKPGYDPSTGFLFVPSADLEIYSYPPTPTRSLVARHWNSSCIKCRTSPSTVSPT